MTYNSILVTGGTGSFGQAYIRNLVTTRKKIKRLVIFSRDELKQSQMAEEFSEKKYPFIRYFLGDVRDYQRLSRALDRIDLVVHAAALKQVPAAEYNPIEFVKTNVIGAQNIIEACLTHKVKKVVALSTDKACAPINLYGATKLCSDKLFIAANNYAGAFTRFSIVRYGNVLGSRGSVLPLILKAKQNNVEFNLTSKKMTRFSITLREGVKVVDWASNNLLGGEILIPKIPSYNIETLLKTVSPKVKLKISGLRKGEKMHEEMISPGDSFTTYDVGKYFMILPDNMKSRCNLYKKKFKKFKKVEENYSYNSKDNKDFLNSEKIKQMIKSY
jgi:UDP-N-acetylglucosamine 4,6-dehydratase